MALYGGLERNVSAHFLKEVGHSILTINSDEEPDRSRIRQQGIVFSNSTIPLCVLQGRASCHVTF